MEKTIKNKQRFFALYWGQEIHFCPEEDVKAFIKVGDLPVEDYDFLELKSLSSISEEDAIHIAMLLVNWQPSMQKLSKMSIRCRQDGDHVWDELILEFSGSFKYTIRYRGGDWMGWINSNGHCEWTLFNHLEVYDYLRSKGYLLPFLDASVKDILKFGWAKIKTE